MPRYADMAARAAAAGFRTFGEAATYTPPAGEPVAVTVVRRQPSAEVSFGTAGFQGAALEADVRASEVAAPVSGASLVIGDQTFVVAAAPRQDAMGRIWTLPLRVA